MSNTLQLYQLQEIDSQIDAAQRRLKEIADVLVETEAYKVAKLNLQNAEKTLKGANSILMNLDLDEKGLQQKIAKHEARLYGGKLVNPKEASSLQDEIASTKRWLAKREEDLLEAMIVVEGAEADYKDNQQKFDSVKAQWETEQSKLLSEQDTLKAKIGSFSEKRAWQSKAIDAADLAVYEALRRKKGGVAVTGVVDDTCQSCGVMLVYRLVKEAEDDTKLSYCESCGRIIYVL